LLAGSLKSEIPGSLARETVGSTEKKKMKRTLAFLVVAIGVFFGVASSAQEKLPLRLLQTIPLPDLKGGDFDHFDVDLPGNRIFLTAEENNAVEVIDIRDNKLIHTIRDVDTPHSLLYLSAAKQLWVIDGGDGILKILDDSTYSVVGAVKLAIGADSAVYDPPRHLLYIATGGEDAKMGFSFISIIDTSTRKRVGDIKVDSTNIEGMAIDKNGATLFANIRDRSLVAVIDTEKRAVTSTWPLGGVRGNTPMALDDANRRLFVVGRKPARLIVLDSNSGKIIATLPTAEITDDMLFDSESKRIYVACDEFVVVYRQRDADHYEELARIPTGFRAKTAILVPQLKRYYVAAPRHGQKIAEVRVYEVQ
jgi:DNA-binding beta-propeller fold protein YncE